MYHTAQVEYELAGNRVHVVVRLDGLGPILCGVTNKQWPFALDITAAYALIMLGPRDLCDHGGTRDEPRPWGAGSPELRPSNPGS